MKRKQLSIAILLGLFASMFFSGGGEAVAQSLDTD